MDDGADIDDSDSFVQIWIARLSTKCKEACYGSYLCGTPKKMDEFKFSVAVVSGRTLNTHLLVAELIL